jgi:hypothetical protein
MSRGPKVKTSLNSPRGAHDRIAHDRVVPTSTLGTVAQAEFERLALVLDARGCLDRVDLSTVTECARVKETLDALYETNDLKFIPLFTSQRRGLLRELGLTIKPSTTLVRSDAKDQKTTDPTAAKIKLHA